MKFFDDCPWAWLDMALGLRDAGLPELGMTSCSLTYDPYRGKWKAEINWSSGSVVAAAHHDRGKAVMMAAAKACTRFGLRVWTCWDYTSLVEGVSGPAGSGFSYAIVCEDAGEAKAEHLLRLGHV